MIVIKARAWLIAALVAPLGALGGQVRGGGLPAVGDSATVVRKVANLTVIQRFSTVNDVVAVRLYLLGGTRQLSDENAGIELLLLRAAELDAWRAQARTGSRRILEAEPDWTVVGFVGLRQEFDSAWAAFARQFARPQFSDAVLERARGELASVARRRYTQPDLRIRVGARRVAFLGHPYARDPEGTPQSLAALTRADVESYWQREFVSSRMLLVVVGAVPPAKLDSLVSGTFGVLGPGRYHWTLPSPPPRHRPNWLVEHQDVPTNYILGYFAGPPPTDRDYFAFRVAVDLLSGLLAWEVRGDRALSYAAYAPFVDSAIPLGGVYVTTSDPGEAITVVRRALVGMEWLEGSRDELRWFLPRSLSGIVVDELLRRSTMDGQAEALARAYLLFGDVAMADEYVPRLRRVTPDALGFIGRNYLQSISFAYMGDTTLMRGRWGN